MLLTNLRYALRLLAKQPALTLAVVALLALGLGASTTVFTLLNAILIRPLPGIAEPERLAMLGRTHQGQGFDPSSYPNYRDYRDQNSVFSGVCAFDHTAMSLSSGGVTERVPGGVVSGNYFEVLGVRPAAGRFFLPQEDQVPGRDPVAIISFRLWQGRFGADPAVVGSKLLLNARPFTVVGVAGKGFLGARTQRPVDVWVPIMAQAHDMSGPQWREQRRANWLDLMARLKPGGEHGQAASRPNLTPALKAGEGAIVGRRSRFSQGLVVFQVALCAVLLVGAGLFERTLGNLRSIDPRMKTDNMLLLSLAPALNGYQRPAARQLYAQLLERIGGLPGVVSVTTALAGPESARPDPAHRQAGLRALADRRSSPG